MIDDELLRDFGRIWPVHVSALTEFLTACRQSFDGDIDLFLVLCIIGDRTFSQRHAPAGLSYDAWNSLKVGEVKSEDINIQSIAESSGIPRETVRRKVNALLEKGWITRDAAGAIMATEKAKRDLEPLTVSSLAYLSRMKALFSGR